MGAAAYPPPSPAPPASPVEKHPQASPDETQGTRALRLYSILRGDVDEVKESLGKAPNPVLGFEGSGIHKPIYRMLLLTEELAERKKVRSEWVTWGLRVFIGALLVAGVSGGIVWLGGFHR